MEPEVPEPSSWKLNRIFLYRTSLISLDKDRSAPKTKMAKIPESAKTTKVDSHSSARVGQVTFDIS